MLPKLSSTQLFAILLIVIMGASTLAIAFISGGGTTDTTPPLAPIDSNSQTTLAYDALVVAKVYKSLNRLTLFGCTNQTDIERLDALTASFDGVLVTNFSSSFRKDPQCPGLIYVAQLSYQPNAPIERLSSQATASGAFIQPPFVLQQALVSVPREVSFHNSAFDLNKTYTFLDPLVTAFVSAQTQANDTINLAISAQFTGSAISQIQAYEDSNPAIASITRQASRIWTVQSLFPTLMFSADANYAAALTPDALKPRIAQLADVNGVEVAFEPASPFLLQFSRVLDANERTDLNALLSDLNSLSSFQIQDGAGKPGTVAVLTPLDYAQMPSIRTAISAALSDHGFSAQDFAFEAPVFTLSGRVDTTTTDTNSIANAISRLIGLKNLLVYQLARATVPFIEVDLTDPSLGNYALDDNQLNFLVLPGKQIGAPVPVLIQFVTVRDRVTQIQSARELYQG
jgi:hypothetical protein